MKYDPNYKKYVSYNQLNPSHKMYTMLQKLLNQSLTKVSLCSIVSVVLLSNCVANSAVMFKQQVIAQTTTNTDVQGQNQQQHQSQNQTGQIISNKILEVRLLAYTLANRLNKSAAILQLDMYVNPHMKLSIKVGLVPP